MQLDRRFEKSIKSILATYCIDCHGPETSEADLNFKLLNSDMIAGNDGETWQRILDQINRGEMPPQSEMQPTTTQRLAKD